MRLSHCVRGALKLLRAECARTAGSLVWLCGGGLYRAARRGELSYATVAWLVTGGLLPLGAAAIAVYAHSAAPGPGLYLLVLFATGLLLGLSAAFRLRSLALWELYAAVLVLWGTSALALCRPGLDAFRTLSTRYAQASGRTHLLGHALVPEPWTLPLGTQLFGPLSDPLLAVYGPGTLLVALWAASCLLLVVGLERGGSWRRERGFALEWRLARRHIRGTHRFGLSLASLITVVGVALGVAALIVTTAVMSGYQADIRDKILGTNAHLVVQKYGLDFTETREVFAAADKTPGIVAAAPFVFNEVMLQAKRRSTGVLLKGIDAQRAAAATNITATLLGDLCLSEMLAPEAGAQRGAPIIVGAALAQRMNLTPGDEVALLTPVAMAGTRGNAPVRKRFVVSGIFRSGLFEFDNHLIYTALPSAQSLLGMGAAVSGVELRLAHPDAVTELAEQMLAQLGHYPFRTLDWRQLNSSIFMALALQKVVMALVLLFIVIVASFNIASTLFMAVVERAPHVAVLKSMGATDATIMKIFVLEGLTTGWLGTALGLVLGLGGALGLGHLQLQLAADVYMVEALSVRIEPQEIAAIVLAASGICHLATLYPALRAARALPAQVLQGLAAATPSA